MATNGRGALPAIAWGWLIGGTLDISYAAVATVLAGRPPYRMLKTIAGGILGREAALAGGPTTAVLGLALHFLIALGAATTYYLASRKVPILTSKPWVCGPVFGFLVYLFMNRVVLPLSALAARPAFTWDGMAAVTFLIGLPIALSVARFAGSRERW